MRENVQHTEDQLVELVFLGWNGGWTQPEVFRVPQRGPADLRRMWRYLLLFQGAPETALEHAQAPLQALQNLIQRSVRQVIISASSRSLPFPICRANGRVFQQPVLTGTDLAGCHIMAPVGLSSVSSLCLPEMFFCSYDQLKRTATFKLLF